MKLMRLALTAIVVLLVSCDVFVPEDMEFWGRGKLESKLRWAKEDITIWLDDIVEDSRCPYGEQCEDAGTVTAEITVQKGDFEAETFTLIAQGFGGYPEEDESPNGVYRSFVITLADVKPYPLADHTPTKSEYVLEIHAKRL